QARRRPRRGPRSPVAPRRARRALKHDWRAMARKCSARDRSLSFGCHRIFVDGPHAAAVRPGSHQEAAMHRKMDSLLPLLLPVAALGSDLLVGASYANAAFLFDGATGALIRQFTNPGPNDLTFGSAVATDGSNVLVAARLAAAVYLFDGTTGDLLRTISTGVS